MIRATAESPALARALAYCEEVTRTRARNFYYGLKLAPEHKRWAAYVLYTWMRRADDIVDGQNHSEDAAGKKLDRLATVTGRAMEDYSLVTDDDPLWLAINHLAAQYPVALRDFECMIEGQRQDLEKTNYETFEELREYCELVASSVGRLCISVWGYDYEEAPVYANARGIAFQLTNILRDFTEDLDAGRVYLPSEDFARFKLSPTELRDWSAPDRCRAFLDAQIARAEGFFVESAPLDSMVSEDCCPVLWAMTEIYHGLLNRIAADPRRIVGGRRVRLSPLKKTLIALEARRMRKVSL